MGLPVHTSRVGRRATRGSAARRPQPTALHEPENRRRAVREGAAPALADFAAIGSACSPPAGASRPEAPALPTCGFTATAAAHLQDPRVWHLSLPFLPPPAQSFLPQVRPAIFLCGILLQILGAT